MPSKKKGKKSSGTKKMGASSKKGDTMKLLVGAIVGGAGTALLDTKVLKTTGNGIKAGGEILVGGVAAWKLKNPYLRGAGIGMLVWGAVRGVSAATGMSIGAIGCTNMVSGFRDVAAIGAPGNIRRFPSPAAVGSARTRAAAVAAGGGY